MSSHSMIRRPLRSLACIAVVSAAAVLSACATGSSFDMSRFTNVKENRAELEFRGVRYELDTYILPFKKPYHVRLNRVDRDPVSSADAVAVATEYIRPRGCTEGVKRVPDLDRSNAKKTEWIIGLSC